MVFLLMGLNFHELGFGSMATLLFFYHSILGLKVSLLKVKQQDNGFYNEDA
jgi:hypothetical protein